MKKPTLELNSRLHISFLTFLFFLSSLSSAQQATETTVIIIPCKSGVLLIDGEVTDTIEANDASKHTLSFGEHYLQLKTTTEKVNQTILIDATSKTIIKLGCENSLKSQAKRLIDKQLNLSGSIINDLEQNIIGLDTDDELILSSAILNKKGKATIFIKEYNTGAEIYKKEGFHSLENEKIRIPSKGIYHITLYTDALFGKDARLIIDRVPGPNSNPNFNTSVKRVYDTTHVEVLNTIGRVHSTTNLSNSNKTTISINLPKNTSYWVYWLAVDQQSQNEMKNLAGSLSKAGKLLSTNPLVHFGMKLIPSLPMFNSTSTIDYKFMDTKNAMLFNKNQQYSYFNFKHADNISTDYSLINTTSSDIVLAMENQHFNIGRDVEIKVVAFIINSKLVMDQ
jgi:hypothetical protein